MRIEFRFVPFPQEIWTGKGIDLTEAEFKLLGYLLYHQGRFGQPIIALTDEEMLNGKRLNDGTRGDSGCGVKGRNNFKAAREKLIAREWIEFEPGKGYRVLLSTIYQAVSETDTRPSESDTTSIRSGQAKRPIQTPKVSKTDTPNKEEEKDLEGSEKEGEDAEDLPPQALAHKVIDECTLPRNPQVFQAIAGAIEFCVKEEHKSKGDAVTFIITCVRDALDRGETVNRFWFDDRAWRKKRANESGTTKTEQLRTDNRAAIVSAALDPRFRGGNGHHRATVEAGAVPEGARGRAATTGAAAADVARQPGPAKPISDA
jgi:hypothetical protein